MSNFLIACVYVGSFMAFLLIGYAVEWVGKKTGWWK